MKNQLLVHHLHCGRRVHNSPSLLLQEKPKQSRKTSTREMHINATDALADLLSTGGSAAKPVQNHKQWHEEQNVHINVCTTASKSKIYLEQTVLKQVT